MNSKPDKLIPALYGGIIMAVISTVPFLSLVNCLCCAGILFGGFMAVYFYKSNFTLDTPPFTSGDCMAVGAMAGVVAALLGTMLHFAFLAMFGNVMGDFLLRMLRNSNFQMPDEALEQIEESLQGGMTAVAMFLTLFQSLILDSLFGLLGGLIGYGIFKPKQQVMPPPRMPEPPAPPRVAV